MQNLETSLSLEFTCLYKAALGENSFLFLAVIHTGSPPHAALAFSITSLHAPALVSAFCRSSVVSSILSPRSRKISHDARRNSNVSMKTPTWDGRESS